MNQTASQNELNALHEVLAKVIRTQVEQTDHYINEEGEMVEQYIASPALLAIAAKFLKDNSITTAIEDDTNLNEIQEILQNKQKKGRLTLATLDTAAGG